MSENITEQKDKNYGIVFQEDIKKLVNIIKTVKYGSVTILIQDGRIVQIEKNEKIRLK